MSNVLNMAEEESLEMYLSWLKGLMAEKHSDTIKIAKRIMGYFPRRRLPDWVEILANGNPDELEAVIQIALADMQEVENDNNNL